MSDLHSALEAAKRYEGCCRAAVDSDGQVHDHANWYGQVVGLEAELAEARAETERFQYAVEAMRIVAREAINLLLRLGAWGLHSSKQQGLHVEALALRDRLAAVDQLGQVATVEAERE